MKQGGKETARPVRRATSEGSKKENSIRTRPRHSTKKPAEITVGNPPVMAGTEPAGSSHIDSLDDVIAHLLQLESQDLPELAQVIAALVRLVSTRPYREKTRELITRASKLIQDIVRGNSLAPGRSLDEAGTLIGQARHEEESHVIHDQSAAPRPIHWNAPPCEESLLEKELPLGDDAGTKTESIGPVAEGVDSTPAESHDRRESTVAAVSVAPHADDSAASFEPDLLPAEADPDLMNEFLTESVDYIEGAEAALLSLEADPENYEAVNSVFRAFHTIKGTSGFMGLKRVADLAHRAESLLSRVRDKEIKCTGVYADLTLRSIDVLKELMGSLRGALTGKPMIRPAGYDRLLKDLADPETLPAAAKDSAPPRLGDLLVASGKVTRENIEAVVQDKGAEPIGVAVLQSGIASAQDVAQALRTQQRVAGSDSGHDTSLRVRTERLDRLIDIVGELVIAQSMVAQDSTIHQVGNHELLKKVTHAGKIVRELQDLTMSMRMVPLKNAFQKMARLARDLAHKNQRQVSFIAEGEDTEIDRNMVDIITDPLVHMVRNAIDHGIEPSDVRQASGKPPAGMLRLAAYHSGGDVVVELQDDGKGLDREKILAKAVSRGLIDGDKNLSDLEVLDLIFVPGFSTADKITDISGRGVGMDVVKRSIEALRGRIEISSEQGQGTKFVIRLPLTLAITDGMLVQVGPERYIIPTVNIMLSFRPEQQSLSTVAGRGELVVLRGDLMPLFRLHRLFGIEDAIEDPSQGLLVVVGDGNRRCALLVDELLGQQQVVAKTLGDGLGHIPGVSGGAILGDGRVGLILDPSEIVALARQGESAGPVGSLTAA
jgi:two-component system, chemotaxis family, sensor kinase CheA